ncbi:scavenger mRNA decapping enzyme, partial [Ostertagia ostertagi]
MKVDEKNGSVAVEHSGDQEGVVQSKENVAQRWLRAASFKEILGSDASHKYRQEEKFIINETAEDYETITVEYIKKYQMDLKCYTNVLSKESEADRIIFEDPDPHNGFILSPDIKWDGTSLENLYVLAMIHRKGVRSIRLRREEVHISENHAAIEKTHRNDDQDQIVLMTAEGRIWNHNLDKFDKAIFFFDTGAQKTIIEENFAMKLGLPSIRTETCTMSGIGGNTEIFKSSIVSVRIGTAYGKDMEILIQTKPVLTKGFPGVRLCAVDKQFLQDRNILVCNPNIRGEHQLPKILVGLDYYYNFILDNSSLITPSGLRLANTVFGPSIHGRGSIDPQDVTTTMPAISYNMTAITEMTKSTMPDKLFDPDGMGIP